MKTQQQMFDKMITGLASQGFKQSLDKAGKCVYRGDAGMKCALGYLIDDEHFTKDCESVRSSYVAALSKSGISTKTEMSAFLNRSRVIHDENENPLDMLFAYKKMASDLRLNILEGLTV